MKRQMWCLVVIGLLIALFHPLTIEVWAQQKVAKKLDGLEIIKKARDLYLAKDQVNTVTLQLIDKEGAERKIMVKRLWKKYGGEDGLYSKTLFWTEFPPDNRGTGFLIWDYEIEGQPDDLWLYLPSLRQTRRMTTRDQDDAFMGSDLTFADMGQRRLDEDKHTFLSEANYNGMPSYVVESEPKEDNSIYGKKVSWISKKDWLIRKIEYFDRNGDLLKTQTIEWQQKEGYPVWKQTVVKNVQTSHRTIFSVGDLSLNNGLSDDEFTERALKRGIRR